MLYCCEGHAIPILGKQTTPTYLVLSKILGELVFLKPLIVYWRIFQYVCYFFLCNVGIEHSFIVTFHNAMYLSWHQSTLLTLRCWSNRNWIWTNQYVVFSFLVFHNDNIYHYENIFKSNYIISSKRRITTLLLALSQRSVRMDFDANFVDILGK